MDLPEESDMVKFNKNTHISCACGVRYSSRGGDRTKGTKTPLEPETFKCAVREKLVCLGHT